MGEIETPLKKVWPEIEKKIGEDKQSLRLLLVAQILEVGFCLPVFKTQTLTSS